MTRPFSFEEVFAAAEEQSRQPRVAYVPHKAWSEAKAAALIRSGVIDGCSCGCRGNFRITDKGKAWLAMVDATKRGGPFVATVVSDEPGYNLVCKVE